VDRRDAGSGREQRILEGAEAKDPAARLGLSEAHFHERLVVGGEASARNEEPEAARDRGEGARQRERMPLADPGELPAREGVADVPDRLAGERDREPVPVGLADQVRELVVPRDPTDADEGSERQRRREAEGPRKFMTTVLDVRRRQPAAESAEHPHMVAAANDLVTCERCRKTFPPRTALRTTG